MQNTCISRANPSPPQPPHAPPRRTCSSSAQSSSPYLICPDERLHCEMVLHQFIYVGLCLNQELGLGQRGKAGTQWRGALVSSAWSSSGIGIAEEDVPRLGKWKEERREGHYLQPKQLLTRGYWGLSSIATAEREIPRGQSCLVPGTPALHSHCRRHPPALDRRTLKLSHYSNYTIIPLPIHLDCFFWHETVPRAPPPSAAALRTGHR